MPSHRAHRASLVIIPLMLLLVGGMMFWQHERMPETSPISRGGHLAHAAGCFACHGQSEYDARRNYRSDAAGENWRARGIDMIWDDGQLEAAEVIEWITHGVPENQRERHQRLLVQMPAYGDEGLLTDQEIDDIAAWSLSEGVRRTEGLGNAQRDMPELTPEAVVALSNDDVLVLGDRLSRLQGCYQCHGEFGQGAVANLASFKGYIPGFQGADFRKLTAGGDPNDIRRWILEGRGDAIQSGPLGGIARHYLDRQAIPMPAYRDILAESEVDILVRYLLLLNEMGPLDAAGVETLATTLANAAE